MLGHKNSLSKFKKVEIIGSIVSDHNSLKINCNKSWKNHKYIEFKQHATEQLVGQKEIRVQNIETSVNDNTTYQNFEDSVKVVVKVYSITGLPSRNKKNLKQFNILP